MIRAFLIALLTSVLALGPGAWAAVSARNGVTVSTSSTINGRSSLSHVNGQALATGGGGPSLIASLHEGLSGGGGGTTASVDTTGANLIVVAVHFYAVADDNLSDSKSNTWTALTVEASGFSKVRLYYCYNPTVGSGHNFTTNLGYSGIGMLAFSGAASSPYDVESGDSATSTTTVQPGSISPSQANTIQVLGWCQDNQAVTPSLNESFTLVDYAQPSSGNYIGGGIAYRVVTSSSAVNPTVTMSGTSNVIIAVLAAFKY